MDHSPLQQSAIPYRRILIIKPGAVGDLLQMTPVFRALKRAFPDATLTMVVGHDSSARLFQHHPHLDEVIIFDRKTTHRTMESLITLMRDLRARKFDLVLNFQRSNLRTWLLVLATLPGRVLVYHKARNRTVHAVVNYLETLDPLGIELTDTSLDFHPGNDEEQYAQDLFKRHGMDSGPVIALNPGATHTVNRWPAERFAELADHVQSELHARALIVGGPDDVELAGLIVDRTRTKPLSIAGTTSLPQLGAVLKRSAIVVSGDTGPMHLATAVGTPVVALFGAADPARTGPVGPGHVVIQASDVPCVPCCSRQCDHAVYLECMQKITAMQVLKVIRAKLQARQRI